MLTSAPAIDHDILVTEDLNLVRLALTNIREAYTEVSLSPDDLDIRKSERRDTRRAELKLPALVTPVDWCTEQGHAVAACGPEQIAVTRDISSTGLGVTHDELLGSDAALVQIDLPGEDPYVFVLDLRWSVRKSRYSYMSGGRVVGLVLPVPEE